MEAASNGAGRDLPAPDTSFSTAFALGWESASLFRGASFDAGRRSDGDDALPGLTGLTAEQRTELAVDLIEAKLRKLEDRLTNTGPVDPAAVEGLREELENEPTADRESLRQAVRRLHLEALRTLTAAELRLGRAYGLGHALADTCLRPCDRESFDEAFGERLVSVKDWLADLASSFPPHSSRAVVLSLRAWERWAADPRLDGEPLVWSTHGVGVCDALHRQGELWRDLLACDKDGSDMLDTNHYISAANALVAKMASTLWRFLRPLSAPLLIFMPVLVLGLWLLASSDAGGQVVGAVLAVAGALGITGAGLRTRLGKVATQLQSRLWGAELDLAIAEAVLIGPPGWGVEVGDIEVPPSGPEPKVAENVAALQQFRAAVAAGKADGICELLAPEVEFVPDGDGPVRQPDPVVAWILEKDNASTVAAPPRRVEAVGTGVLITHRDGAAQVWRVQEGKVRQWTYFADGERARTSVEGNGTGE
jgi:hypothetical protein